MCPKNSKFQKDPREILQDQPKKKIWICVQKIPNFRWIWAAPWDGKAADEFLSSELFWNFFGFSGIPEGLECEGLLWPQKIRIETGFKGTQHSAPPKIQFEPVWFCPFWPPKSGLRPVSLCPPKLGLKLVLKALSPPKSDLKLGLLCPLNPVWNWFRSAPEIGVKMGLKGPGGAEMGF